MKQDFPKQNAKRNGQLGPGRSLLRYSAILLFPFMLASCGGDATEVDALAVRDRFVSVRFVAPFREKLRNLNDGELFKLSCRDKRVSCEKVMKILEKKDPEFVKALKGSSK